MAASADREASGKVVEKICCNAHEERFSGKYVEKIKRLPEKICGMMWNPRRFIHALKVGSSLTLVSLLYLVEPLSKGIGQNAIWAVMTVFVGLRFNAGATLRKGLNRGSGTLLAVSLAFLIEYVTTNSGQVLRAVFIGGAVFLIGATATYIRSFPYIKKNYNYGVVSFLWMFNWITVSSYRDQNVLKIAYKRLSTIAIGCVICLFMALWISPNRSGEDLHNSTVSKLERLERSIEACVNEYFSEVKPAEEGNEPMEDRIYKIYKAVLDSKTRDETLALHASWERRHKRHRCISPWKQYIKLGAVLRHFVYTVVALHGCSRTEKQTPLAVRALFEDPCIRLAKEVQKVLMELANSVRHRRQCSPEILSNHLHEALQDLNIAIKSQLRLFLGSNYNQTSNMLALAAAQASQKSYKVSLPCVKTDSSALPEWRTERASEQSRENERKCLRPQQSKIAITGLEFSEALPFAAFAALLVETVARLNLVIREVKELGQVACFKEFRTDDQISITCERLSMDVEGCIIRSNTYSTNSGNMPNRSSDLLIDEDTSRERTLLNTD